MVESQSLDCRPTANHFSDHGITAQPGLSFCLIGIIQSRG